MHIRTQNQGSSRRVEWRRTVTSSANRMPHSFNDTRCSRLWRGRIGPASPSKVSPAFSGIYPSRPLNTPSVVVSCLLKTNTLWGLTFLILVYIFDNNNLKCIYFETKRNKTKTKGCAIGRIPTSSAQRVGFSYPKHVPGLVGSIYVPAAQTGSDLNRQCMASLQGT